jgi:hypothetical protein
MKLDTYGQRTEPAPRTEVEHAAYVSKRAIGLQRMRDWAAGRVRPNISSAEDSFNRG